MKKEQVNIFKIKPNKIPCMWFEGQKKCKRKIFDCIGFGLKNTNEYFSTLEMLFLCEKHCLSWEKFLNKTQGEVPSVKVNEILKEVKDSYGEDN